MILEGDRRDSGAEEPRSQRWPLSPLYRFHPPAGEREGGFGNTPHWHALNGLKFLT